MRPLGWRPKPGDVVVRRRRLAELRPVIIPLPLPHPARPGLSSPLTLAYGFGALLLVGTLLLLLPWANHQGGVTPWMTALFTAASAATVTGLTVVDTPTFWTPLGQGVILALILIGGTGWMTLAGFLLMVLGARITLPHRLAFREALGSPALGGIVRLLRNMVLTFLGIQLAAALLLGYLWRQGQGWEWPIALWQGAFHAVSAFNNAGFTILPNSSNFSALHSSLGVLLLFAFLIILGGLSFPVLADLARVRRFSRLHLDTKMVLVGSALLWALGWAVFLAFEARNPDTMGPFPLGEKVVNALFHSVSARTAGFSTVEIGKVAPATAFFLTGLMFIGTASASTGGGIRLNTAGVLVATLLASLRGRRHVTAFGREMGEDQVHRAIALAIIGLALVFFIAFFLTFTERVPFINLLFDTVSGLGTVGLTMGEVPGLSPVGKGLIILTMLAGRIGPLALALALLQREGRPVLYRFAEERVRIG